jgi:hypothetical protein
LNETHHYLVCIDNVNLLSKKISAMKMNAETVYKHIVRKLSICLSHEQNVGPIYSMKRDNKFIENVARIRYLGKVLSKLYLQRYLERIQFWECLLLFVL